jgi:large subunit ribosomal protein L9
LSGDFTKILTQTAVKLSPLKIITHRGETIVSKRVPLILNKDVKKLGKAGDLVEVAPGYARNYLLPQGMAYRVTAGVLKQVERRKEEERKRILAEKEAAKARKTALETIGRFTIAKRVGEGEAIFGTVTDREVAEVILSITSQEVDRRGITLPDISKLGFYKVQIKLHPEVTAEVEIQVVAE